MQLSYLESKSGRPYVLHDIQKMNADDQERMTFKIELLTITGLDPEDKNMKKLKAYDGLYELKVRSNGVNYRIFFTILRQEICVVHMASKKAAEIVNDYETAQARIYAWRKDKEE